jgi:hypothetical protein
VRVAIGEDIEPRLHELVDPPERHKPTPDA